MGEVSSQMKKISIYIHIPFCIRKCAYCDFLSAPAAEEDKRAYVTALCKEIACWKEKMAEYEVDTVFFGGGTPSCLPDGLLEKVLCKLKETFNISKEAEISVEVNPGTVDINKLQSYFKEGVNRLSIGLQSPFEEDLKQLGRIHTYDDFMLTYRSARTVGFENINIDLMSSLPGQTLERYIEGVKRVLALEPEHISAYSLIVEEGTPFYDLFAEHPELLPDEDTDREMYEQTREILKEHGYERYEISNYAKPGKACRHNLTYWKRGNYLGVGLGASSLLEEVRFKGIMDLKSYVNSWNETIPQYQEVEHLSKKDQMEEFMFLGLRCMEGVSRKAFYQKFGVTMEAVYGEKLKLFQKEGLMEVVKGQGEDCDRVHLTLRGIDVSNEILAEFLL